MRGAKDQYQLAFTYTQAGQLKEAESCLQDLFIRYPEHPDVLHLFGIVLKSLNKVEQSERLLRAAVHKCPQNPSFHYTMDYPWLNPVDRIKPLRRSATPLLLIRICVMHNIIWQKRLRIQAI